MNTIEDIEVAFPQTLDGALKLMADEAAGGRPLAGGTDLLVQWQTGVLPIPGQAISLAGIPALKGIKEKDDTVVIGALVTHAELRSSELVQRWLPATAASAATVGGAQIQALGTIAGNVANASPAGDLPPALLVTDGKVIVASVDGEREVALAKFFLGYRELDLRPHELIVRFVLPKLHEGCSESFRKLGTRAAQAISKVMGACRLGVEDGMIKHVAMALGSVAPTVVRLPKLESWLSGRELTEETIAEAEGLASDEVHPIADIRSTMEYRKWVSGRIVRGFLEGAVP